MSIIDSKYPKEYREKLGFTNQSGVKDFFGAKDVKPTIDYNYIGLLNERLQEIIVKIDNLAPNEIQQKDIKDFCSTNIDSVYQKLTEHNILSKLNNQGRRPEQVYFSWMRGYVISNYFLKSLSLIFDVNIEDIKLIGDDDLIKIETFKRTPKADLEVTLKDGQKIRLEIQSGFQGINDIKQHKVLEAKRLYREDNISSLAIHFDLFNGQAAFVKLDEIEEDNINWITRINMGNGVLYNIDQNYFV